MLDLCKWYNEPAQWNLSATGLAVVTNRATDFWRKTHYGFTNQFAVTHCNVEQLVLPRRRHSLRQIARCISQTACGI
jgi:hypothetical protein